MFPRCAEARPSPVLEAAGPVPLRERRGAHSQWLAQEQYDFIVAHVPIL
jgi:hypothetical protein